jgi:hypothetical protein
VRLDEEPYGVSAAGLQMLPAPSGASACVAAEKQGLSLSLWSGDIGCALNV